MTIDDNRIIVYNTDTGNNIMSGYSNANRINNHRNENNVLIK